MAFSFNIKIHFIYSYRSHYWCFLVCWLQLPRRRFFNVKINFIYNYRNHYWYFLVCWLQLPWRRLFNVKIHFIYSYRNHYWSFLVCWLQLPWRRLFNVKIHFILQLQKSLLMFPGLLMPLLDKCSVNPDSEVTSHIFFNATAQYKWDIN